MAKPFRCPECRHILPGGRKCHSLALKGKAFCPAHLRRRTLVEANRARNHSVALPPLEDRAALQMALDEVLAALAAHKITRREAGTYLFALQIGAQNLARMEQLPPPDPIQFVTDEHGDILAADEPPSAGATGLDSETGETTSLETCSPEGCPGACPERVEESPALGDLGDHNSPPASQPDPKLNSDPIPDDDNDPSLLLDNPNTRDTHEYDPERPLSLTPRQLRERRKRIEESLRSWREAQKYYAAMPQDDPNQNPPLVLAYLQKNIDKAQAELQDLNEQAAPDPP